MAKLGIVTGSGGQVGVGTGRAPHLVNLNEDPLMSELLLYYLSAEHPTKLGFDTEDFQAGSFVALSSCV